MRSRIWLIAICVLLVGVSVSAVASGEVRDYAGTWQATYARGGIGTQSTLTLNEDGTCLWIIDIPDSSVELARWGGTWQIEGRRIAVTLHDNGDERIELGIGDGELLLFDPSDPANAEKSVVHTRDTQEEAPSQPAASSTENAAPLPDLPAAWQATFVGDDMVCTLVFDDAGVILRYQSGDGDWYSICGDYTVESGIITIMPGINFMSVQLKAVDGCLTVADESVAPFPPIELPEWYADMANEQTTLPEDMLGTWVAQLDSGITVTFGKGGSILMENYEETLTSGHIVKRGQSITGFSDDSESRELIFLARVIDGDTPQLNVAYSDAGYTAYDADTGIAIFHKGEKQARPVWTYRLDDAGRAVITAHNEEFPDGFVAVPEALDGVPVVGLAERLFEGRSDVLTVSLPEGLISIGEGAFRNCASLTDITLPASLTNIGANTFAGCASLTSITLPADLTSVGAGTFAGCVALTNITFPASLTNIGAGAFAGCLSLAEMDVPNGVSELGQGCFAGCAGLTRLTLPGTVETVSVDIFKDCSSLKEVFVEEGVVSIACGYFEELPEDVAIYLPRSVESIGQLNAMDVTIYAYEDSWAYTHHWDQFDPYGSNNAVWSRRSESAATSLESDPVDELVGTWVFDELASDGGRAEVIAFTDDFRFQYGVSQDENDSRIVTRSGEGTFTYHDGSIFLTIDGENTVCSVIKGRTLSIRLWGRDYTQKSGYTMPDF